MPVYNKTRRNKNKNKLKNKRQRASKTFRTMNCSPAVKGKTPIKGSCFTPDVLSQLKQSYNKYHPENIINVTDSVEIWKELKSRLSTCSKEDCWLDTIDDKNIRDKIDEYIFAPDQPGDWDKYDGWLSNFDILKVLKQFETSHKNFRVIGPTPIDFDSKPRNKSSKCVWDELCDFDAQQFISKGKTKIGIVFNLDKHYGKGKHWVSMFVDLDDCFIFYLDSGGDKAPKEVKNLANRITKQCLALPEKKKIHYYENCPIEHQMGTRECGMYALFFIITMLTGEADGKQLPTYMDRINFFKDKRIPDTYVRKYREIYFNTVE
jgi:hypothetical protein